MKKIRETAAVRKWNAMMDALEANWLVKMADPRKAYPRDRLPSDKKLLEPPGTEPPSA